jgi:hypothetical protein
MSSKKKRKPKPNENGVEALKRQMQKNGTRILGTF